MRQASTMDRARAEAIGIEALSFLGAEEKRLHGFLAASGLTSDSVRNAAASSGFFAGVLDYIVADEELLLGFARETDRKPETVVAARSVLSPPAWFD